MLQLFVTVRALREEAGVRRGKTDQIPDGRSREVGGSPESIFNLENVEEIQVVVIIDFEVEGRHERGEMERVIVRRLGIGASIGMMMEDMMMVVAMMMT